MEKALFPHIQKSVDSFLYDEEGNIPVNKVLTIGSMLLVLGYLLNQESFAAHSSHRSHSSHSSHRSGYGGYGGEDTVEAVPVMEVVLPAKRCSMCPTIIQHLRRKLWKIFSPWG